jgi:hypothetical protein
MEGEKMSSYKERLESAKRRYKQGLLNVKNNPEPKGQKFQIGSRVHICKDLGGTMSHFESDCNATVKYTHAHAYGGDDIKSYCLDIDGIGRASWYEEWQLTSIDEKK